MVDVMVTCPATRSKVETNQTDEVQGRAAQLGFNNKTAKYHDVDQSAFTVLPFVIETGVRIHHKACEWLDAFAEGGNLATRLAVKNIYKTIARKLQFLQADMIWRYNKMHIWDPIGRQGRTV